MVLVVPKYALQRAMTEIDYWVLHADSPGRIASRKFRRRVDQAIAVSGGVDSTALAIACAELQSQYHDRYHVKALIVDHKSHPGSTDVANRTHSRMEALGLQSQVLTLKWQQPDPQKLSNFEEQARILRYRALAQACADFGARTLVTAHHADDQAETVLMGLQYRETGLNLRNMKSRAPVPESTGIYGADHSGLLTEREFVWRTKQRLVSRTTLLGPWQLPQWTNVVEYGRLCMVRPFLKLEKDELVSICRSSRVPWEDDPSNLDVTLTQRNTVRHSLTHDRLPTALRKESLLCMWLRNRKRSAALSKAFHFVERNCEIVTFDIRSGLLKVRLPKNFFKALPIARLGWLKYIAAGMLESFLQPVSPHQHVKYSSLEIPVLACFPDLAELLGTLVLDDGAAVSACGVVLRREFELQEVDSGRVKSASVRLDKKYVWTLSREPFRSGDSYIPRIEYPSLQRLNAGHARNIVFNPWSEWKLWDGRYWIQIKNRTQDCILVRPFSKKDLGRTREILTKTQYKDLMNHLRVVAPGKVRFTLPAIFRVSDKRSADEELIALPSLGRKGDFPANRNLGVQDIDWRIRYKHFSLRANSSEVNTDDDVDGKLISLKYDSIAFKSWMHDEFLEGTVVTEGPRLRLEGRSSAKRDVPRTIDPPVQVKSRSERLILQKPRSISQWKIKRSGPFMKASKRTAPSLDRKIVRGSSQRNDRPTSSRKDKKPTETHFTAKNLTRSMSRKYPSTSVLEESSIQLQLNSQPEPFVTVSSAVGKQASPPRESNLVSQTAEARREVEKATKLNFRRIATGSMSQKSSINQSQPTTRPTPPAAPPSALEGQDDHSCDSKVTKQTAQADPIKDRITSPASAETLAVSVQSGSGHKAENAPRNSSSKKKVSNLKKSKRPATSKKEHSLSSMTKGAANSTSVTSSKGKPEKIRDSQRAYRYHFGKSKKTSKEKKCDTAS